MASACLAWRRDVLVAIKWIFPDSQEHLNSFTNITFVPFEAFDLINPETCAQYFRAGVAQTEALLQSMAQEIRSFWKDDEIREYTEGSQTTILRKAFEAAKTADPQIVFVVHGRNEAARKSIFDFLRAIGLKPLEWSQAVAATGKGSPYVGEILDAAFSKAQAVVVLMTPDDEAILKTEFRSGNDEAHESHPSGQARPNVLFEAGMAMGRSADRTVLVQIGTLRPFSDVGGRHLIRLTNSSQRRHDLADRLKTAGCAVDLNGRDWHTAGSFDMENLQIASEQDSKAKEDHRLIDAQPSEHSQPTALPLEWLEMISATGDDGRIMLVSTSMHGEWVVCGQHHFFDVKDASIQAKYRDILDSLLVEGYVRRMSQKNFVLTGRGFEIRKRSKITIVKDATTGP
jgi:predicted nucleotide-binding protein